MLKKETKTPFLAISVCLGAYEGKRWEGERGMGVRERRGKLNPFHPRTILTAEHKEGISFSYLGCMVIEGYGPCSSHQEKCFLYRTMYEDSAEIKPYIK